MNITLSMLQRGVHQVGRTLLTPHAGFANAAMATSAAIERERRMQGKPLLDVWFEIHDQYGTHYIMERSDGGGEYRRTLPPTVPQSQVVKIVISGPASPATDLLDQLQRLLERFQTTAQLIDQPTKETLELADASAAQPRIPELLSTIQNIRTAIFPDYDMQVASEFVSQLVDAARGGGKPFAAVQQAVSVIRQSSEVLRTSLLADSTLALFPPVFHDLTTALLERDVASAVPRAAAETAYLTRIVELQTVSNRHPLHLLGFVVARALRGGGQGIVLRLANLRFDSGRALIQEALDAKTRDAHGQALYRAAVMLLASRELFRALVESAPRLPSLDLPAVMQLSSVSEEETIKVQDALLFALRDRGDDLLDAARRNMQALAAQPGKATGKVTELIEQKYYYPRLYAPYLTGKGPKPPDEGS